MLNPEDKYKKAYKKTQGKQTSAYKKTVLSMQSALQKKPDLRSQSQNQAISSFLQLSPFFSELAEHISNDFARNIIKRSTVYTVNGNKRFQEKGERISNILMVLQGNFFIRRCQSKQEDEEAGQSLKQVYQRLVRNANKSSLAKKQGRGLQRRLSILQNQLQTEPVPNFNQLTDLVKVQQQGQLLIGDIQKQRYTDDLYLKGQGLLLGISIAAFFDCLTHEYERILIEQTGYFRTLRCFDILEDSQLKILIERISLVQYKKDQFVFKEGEESKYFYLLIQGEAKASKNVALFKEDPNNLYRSHSKSQSSRRAQRPQQFSYANFEGVFNYTPKTRRIDLGVLSPITIFGQEEITTGLKRQAEVQIKSLKAKLYCFNLQDLEGSGNGKKIDVARFLDELYESITSKRIVARRKALSSSLQFQNKRNMNYFFLQPSPTVRKRPRSVTQKINHSIRPVTIARPQSSVKPRYDNFNFNEFFNESRTSNISLSMQQMKVVGLTHSPHDIAQKVEAESMLFTQRQSYKHKINVMTPLFDINYYKKQRKEVLRIENKRRMRIIEVVGVSKKKA